MGLNLRGVMPGIIWIALIGLLAGLIARFLLPGPNNPHGFLVTIVLGIAGAFVATVLAETEDTWNAIFAAKSLPPLGT